MKKIIVFLSIALTAFALTRSANAQVGDKDDPMPKTENPTLGDKDELVQQNKRMLKVRNETSGALTLYVQFRTLRDGVWTWVPGDPATSGESMSFELPSGAERDVLYEGDPVAASRIRVAATSATHKWLHYTRKDLWLVPERNEDGEHVYLAESVEPFTVAFARTKEKEEIAFESPSAGLRTYPTEGTEIPPPPEDIPWDSPPPDAPHIHDLSVLPAQISGANVVLRVQNQGHANPNIERHLVLQRVIPAAAPVELGHVGHLFHLGVRTFYLVGLKPGKYRASLSPGDEAPYEGNDTQLFTITATTFTDLAILPVNVIGKKVFIKVKNVGTQPGAGGTHLRVMKWPGGLPTDHGIIGPLPVNAMQMIPPFDLLPGNYKAFLTPGDAPPFQSNDVKHFTVTAAGFVDLEVLPVTVFAGQAHVKVRNIGTMQSPAPGPHVKVKKLPVGPIKDLGPVGGLPSSALKSLPPVPVGFGAYRAYLDPGDPLPYKANDFDDFTVGALIADLQVNNLSKVGLAVHGQIKNNGPGKYNSGPRQWFLERKLGILWVPAPSVGSHVIPDLNAGASCLVQGAFVGPGTYRLRLSPPDANAGNDSLAKNLP